MPAVKILHVSQADAAGGSARSAYRIHATLRGLGHASRMLAGIRRTDDPDVRPLKPGWQVCGRAATLSAVSVAAEPARPYEVEMTCIDGLKPGEVLVATTNGDRSSALWGELLSTAARARGAAGAVIDGLTRDAARILGMDFPVFASGFSPPLGRASRTG